MNPSITPSERAAMLGRMLEAFGSCATLDALAPELDEQLDRLTDAPFAEGFHAMIGVGCPQDYLARLVEIDSARMLCAIRFYGGDPRRPFVDILASTGAIADHASAADVAREAFGVFGAGRVRLLCPAGREPTAGSGYAPVADQVLAVGVCRDMGEKQGGETVTLVDADPDEGAAFVADRYRAFAERNPELAARVFASDRDDLAACADSGRLAWWEVGGERAGLIAAQRERAFGIDGYLMIEEVADPAFAGRGTAALAQRALGAWLERRDPGSVMMGTIDAANTPSRRTAARAGRREACAWWFLAADEAEGAW